MTDIKYEDEIGGVNEIFENLGILRKFRESPQ